MALNLPKPSTPATTTAADNAPAAPPIRRPTSGGNGHKSATTSAFKEATSISRSPRLVVDIAGVEKSGKTRFGFTAPGPIYMHSFDIGTEGVIEKFLDKKKIYVAEYELEIQPGEASDKEVAIAAEKVWNKFVENFRDGLASCGNGTTLVDSGTEQWELLRLARFGRLVQILPHYYVALNKEMQTLIRECYNHNGSTVFTTKMKPAWENYVGTDGKEKGRKTGEFERAGFKDMPFQVQVVATTERIDREGGGSDFQMTIDSCRHNPDLNGMVMENDFETLMSLVFG